MVENIRRPIETVDVGKERCEVELRGEERNVKNYIKSSSHQFHPGLIGSYVEEKCEPYMPHMCL